MNDNPMIVNRMRVGNSSDPYVEKSESLKIDSNGIVFLSEVPNNYQHVTVTGNNETWYEIYDGIPNSNQFKVDYDLKKVTFSLDNVGKQLNFDYLGEGLSLLSSDVIYTELDSNSNVVQTLKSLTDDTNTAKDNAETATSNANTQAQYALDQGNYAKGIRDNFGHKGDYSSTATYNNGNVVTYGGINYFCIQDTSAGIDPLNGAYWTVVSPQANINTQTWTATEGQTVFTITNGNYVPNEGNIEVLVGGVPQVSGQGFTETDSTTITLSEGVSAGIIIFAKWFEGTISITKDHNSTHELGGQDELDLAKLYNYKEMVSDKFDSVNASLAEIVYVNPKSNKYEAKGDGVTDDTTALQNAINDLPNGGTFILPVSSGDYRFSSLDFSGKQNCFFHFFGSLKLLDSIITPYGSVIVGNANNNFYNLTIDGNRANVIDQGNPGVTSNLLLTSTAKNIWFYNLTLKESIWSASIFNGKAQNIHFEGLTLQNIGEHGFYCSGGLSNTIYFKNVTVDSLNLNPNCVAISHESYFCKSRGDTLGNNFDFFFENIVQTQTLPAKVSSHFLLFNNADNFYAKKIKLGTNVNFCILGTNISKLEIDDITTPTGSQIIYNYDTGSIGAEVYVKNSHITGGQQNFNIVREYENCEFDVNATWDTIDTTNFNHQKVLFTKCKFKPDGGVVRFEHIIDHITFDNCTIASIAASAVSNSFFLFGVTLVNANKFIRFLGCNGVFTNYSHAIGLYPNTNLVISNSFMDKDITSLVGQPNSISMDTVDTTTFAVACTYSNGIALKNFFRGVKYNNIDYSKKKYQITVASGATTSPTTNYQYDLCRFPVMADIQISPTGPLNGITSYWPVLDTVNHLISVACNPAPTAPTTFNVMVDVTTQ